MNSVSNFKFLNWLFGVRLKTENATISIFNSVINKTLTTQTNKTQHIHTQKPLVQNILNFHINFVVVHFLLFILLGVY